MQIAESQAMEKLQNDKLIQVMVTVQKPRYIDTDVPVALND